MKQFLTKSNAQLNEIVSLVRTGVSASAAKVLKSLIVIDVHSRDILEKLIAEEVHSVDDFSWTSHMRY
jgi:dynein heavy chain